VLLKVAEVVGPEVTTVDVEPLVVVVVVVGAATVVVGVVVVVAGVVAAVAVLSFQQTLFSPGAGSPKLALVQSTELANDFTTELVVVPYLTDWVPLKEQVPYSCAHTVQACAVAVGDVDVGAVVIGVDAPEESTAAVVVPPLPPPQAARTMEVAATIWESNARRVVREREVRSFIDIL